MIHVRGLCLAGAALALAVNGASAQEGGQRLTGTLSQTFSADTNFALEDPSEDTSFRSVTTLGIGYLTETRTERFSLDSDISLRWLRDGDGETDLVASRPSVELSYGREASRSRFEVGAYYREVPISFLRALEVEVGDDGEIDVPDPEDFIGGGDQARYGADVELTFGVDTPIEVTLRTAVDMLDYTDVTDPDLNDTETVTLGASARFEISPVVDATLALTGVSRSEEDAVSTEIDTLTLRGGIDYAASEVLSYSFGAYVTDEEETTTGGTTSDTTYGVDVGMRMERPTNTFSGTIGLATTGDDDTIVTARVSFDRELPQGASLTGGLSRSLTFGTGGDDLAVTGATVSYVRPINSVSSTSLGLSYSLTEDLGGTDPDESRLTFSAGYSRLITEDLSLSLGYAYRLRDEGTLNADSHNVSLGLSMPFSF